MPNERLNIKRGSIILVDLGEVLGSEQGGIRPAVVFQNAKANQFSPTVTIIPMTTRVKTKLPTHIELKVKDGVDKDCIVLTETIRTVARERILKLLGEVENKNAMRKIEIGLMIQTEMISVRDGMRKMMQIEKEDSRHSKTNVR